MSVAMKMFDIRVGDLIQRYVERKRPWWWFGTGLMNGDYKTTGRVVRGNEYKHRPDDMTVKEAERLANRYDIQVVRVLNRS